MVSQAWQLARPKWVKIFIGKVAVESSRVFLLLSVSFSEKDVAQPLGKIRKKYKSSTKI